MSDKAAINEFWRKHLKAHPNESIAVAFDQFAIVDRNVWKNCPIWKKNDPVDGSVMAPGLDRRAVIDIYGYVYFDGDGKPTFETLIDLHYENKPAVPRVVPTFRAGVAPAGFENGAEWAPYVTAGLPEPVARARTLAPASGRTPRGARRPVPKASPSRPRTPRKRTR